MGNKISNLFRSKSLAPRAFSNATLQIISSVDVENILNTIKNENAKVVYLKSLRDGFLYTSHELKDPNISFRIAQNLSGITRTFPVFNHEIIIVDGWNKNAVYYNLDNTYFPNAKYIMMFSHPCEYATITRSPKWHWILPNSGNHRWFNDFNNVTKLSTSEQFRLESILAEFKPVYTTDWENKLIPIEESLA